MRIFFATLVIVAVAFVAWLRLHGSARESDPGLHDKRTATIPVYSAPEIDASPPAPLPTISVETDEQRLNRIKRFGDIPYEKWVRVQPIVLDYMEVFLKFTRELDGSERTAGNDIARWEAKNVLKRERRADLAAAGLSSVEIDEIELHVTPVGQNLLDNLKDVTMTGDELHAMFRVWDFNDTNSRSSGRFSPAEAALRERARLAMYEQGRAILGAERFATFLKRADLAYRRFAQLAEDTGRPPSVADQLWQLKSELSIRRGESTESAQNTSLEAEVRSRVVAMVGADAIEKNPWAFEQWLAPSKSGPPRIAPTIP